MKLTRHAAPLLVAAPITCTAMAVPAAAVASAATNKAGKPIKVGGLPSAVAITPNGKTAYVSNNGSGTVTPISTATNTADKAIKAGTGPYAIAITP